MTYSVKLIPYNLFYSADDTVVVELTDSSGSYPTFNVYVENSTGTTDPPYPYPIGLSITNNDYYTWATNKLDTYYENIYDQATMDSNITFVFINNNTYTFKITYDSSEYSSNPFIYVESYTITVTSDINKLVYYQTDTISITSTSSSYSYQINNNNDSTTVYISEDSYSLSNTASGSYCISRYDEVYHTYEASKSFYVIANSTLTLSTTSVSPGTTITITSDSTFDTLYLYCNNTSSLIDKITYGSQNSQTYTAYNLTNNYQYFFATSNVLTDALISDPFTYVYTGTLVLDPSSTTYSYGTSITITNKDGSILDQIGTLYIYDTTNTIVDTIVTTTLTEYTYSIGNLTNGSSYYYKNSNGVISATFEFTKSTSLTLENNNGRTATYYYGDVITISSDTLFQEILLCISSTNPVSIFSSYNDTYLQMDGLDDSGNTVTNTYYDSRTSCYYKYTIPNTLIYNQTYFFATPNFSQISETFIYSIKQDLNISSDSLKKFIYKIGDTINISSDTSIEELRLCTTVTTNTLFISYPNTTSYDYVTSWSDLNSLTNDTGGSITGTYFFATSNYEQVSSSFNLHGILLNPYKTRYFYGETVTLDEGYTYYITDGETSTQISTNYTFSGLTDDTKYYIYYENNDEIYTSHTFLYKDLPSSFYVIPTMDTFYNADDDNGGQSYKKISSRFITSKYLIVPFGGNNVNKQQGTSEAHCYFVTSIINQYMLKYFTYKSTNNLSDITALLDLLIYSINFISEMVSINLEETYTTDDKNTVKATMGNVFFPPWEFYIDSNKQLHGCNDGNGTVPWTAQDSNQQLLCSLIRLWIFEQQNPYLATYPCTNLIDKTDITGSAEYSSDLTTFDWDTSSLSSTSYLLDNLTSLIEKYIFDFTKSGSYNISDGIPRFGSGTVDLACGASIEDEKWPDYVSFYLYVLIQYYIDNSSYITNYSGVTNYVDISTYYTPALEQDIAWIYNGPLNEIVTTSGDQVSATFNRLVFQITELVEVYNNGDSTIGLSSSDVKKYFDFEYYVKICAVLSNLLTSEISYNALTLSFTDSSLSFYYIDSGDNTLNTYTLGSAVISGYYRMISYLLMLENNIYPQYTRNTTSTSTIVPIQGTWPTIDGFATSGASSLILDIDGEPNLTNSGSGMTSTNGTIVAILTPSVNYSGYWEYQDYKISGLDNIFVAGYFTLEVNDDGVYTGHNNVNINLPTYTAPSENTVFNLYYCNSTCPSTGPSDISHLYSVSTGTTTYLESMTLNQLIGDNSNYSFNLYGQATAWSSKYTSQTESDFTSSWMNYFQGDQRNSVEADGSGNSWSADVDSGTKSWCCNSGPYFAWHMGTLHMSNYRLNH